MGFGIREPRTTTGEHVPGTALIYCQENDIEVPSRINLKRGTGGNADVILVPQPSESPNDPLNWPKWKKDLAFFSVCLSTSIGAALGPFFSPITVSVAKEFKVSIPTAAQAGGWPLMSTALGALILQAWAPIMGKRSSFLVSTLIIFTGTIWCSLVKAPNFSGLVAARTFQGVGVGAYESLVVPIIGDLYFVHERGKRIVFLTIISLGCSTFEPILGGYMAQTYGWRLGMKVLIGFSGVALLFIIFGCPETTFVRASIYETDVRSMEDVVQAEKAMTTTKSDHETSATCFGSTQIELDVITEKPKTYWQELKPIDGVIVKHNPLKLFARPFVCILYPAVFWGFTVGGLWAAWVIGIAIVVSQIFGGPPHFYDASHVGFLFVFPFIFIVVGSCLGFVLADWWPKWCARRNNGIFEPEFRLILLVPALMIGIPGLFGFGNYASQGGIHWVAASALSGMISFAAILAGSVSFGYILDCHRDHSVEVTVAITLLRNMFCFGSSYFLPRWLAATKTWKVFDIIGGLQLGITFCSIFIYVFGKHIRSFVHKNDPLKIFGLA